MYTEEQLLQELQKDPREAMVRILDQYTGLLWNITANHLSDPEDIKECVNDTFMDFYMHHRQYDPARASLATYLAAIARNKAVSRYRQNLSRPVSAGTKEDAALGPASADPLLSDAMENAELKMDLQKAMAALKPGDQDIIRMKYYGGMTIQEIADSLGLPYETVKKRHQRSLSRMRMILLGLTIAALIALLSACAYMVLRYFGVFPGYGISRSQEEPVYLVREESRVETDSLPYARMSMDGVMEEGTVPAVITLKDGMLIDRKLLLSVQYEAPEAAFISPGQVYLSIGAEQLSGPSSMTMEDESHCAVVYQFELDEPAAKEEALALTLEFPALGLSLPFEMRQAQAQDLEGFSYSMGERGGLMAISRVEDGDLIASIYPLSLEEFPISPGLLTNRYHQGKAGDITLVPADENGGGESDSPIVAEAIYRPMYDLSYYDWNFGSVESGDYRIHVPYVYLELPAQGQSFSVYADPDTWTGDPLLLPEGTLRMAGLEYAGKNGNPDIPSDNWKLTLIYEPQPGSDLELYFSTASFVYLDAQGTERPELVNGFLSPDEIPEANHIEYVISIAEGSDPPAGFRITLDGTMFYRWMHPFDLEVHADAPPLQTEFSDFR